MHVQKQGLFCITSVADLGLEPEGVKALKMLQPVTFRGIVGHLLPLTGTPVYI